MNGRTAEEPQMAAVAGGRAPQAAHSLMNELPPRPPSPYKTVQRKRAGGQYNTVTSMFMKGRRAMVMSAGNAAPSREINGDASRRGISPPASFPGDHRYIEKGCDGTASHDEGYYETLFQESQCRSFIAAQENACGALCANEEVAFTNLMIDELRERAKLLAGNDAAELVVNASQTRAEARRAMMMTIEQDVAARLHEERVKALLAAQFDALLPGHAAGRDRIIQEEVEDLKGVFVWHRENRPVGAGCFIRDPAQDYRLRDTSIGRGRGGSLARSSASASSRGSAVRTSRDYIADLRRKTGSSHSSAVALGALVVTEYDENAPSSILDGNLPPNDEEIFAAEGRARLLSEKNRMYQDLRERRQRMDLTDEASAARELILAGEAAQWMQIVRQSFDECFTAEKAARAREKRELLEGAAATDRAAQKQALRERLIRQRGLPIPRQTQDPNADLAVVRQDRVGAESPKTPNRPTVNTSSVSRVQLAPLEHAPREGSSSTIPDEFSPTVTSFPPLSDEAAGTMPREEGQEEEFVHLSLITGATTDARTLA